MKKNFIALCSVCVMLLSLCLTACGTTHAKIVGIMTGIVAEYDHTYSYTYGNPLSDNKTLVDYDYNLQVGQDYFLAVTYSQTGGSIICSITTEHITLKYDTEVLEITLPEEKEGVEVFYTLKCKKPVVNTAVIVEVDCEYSEIVIINAK